MGTRRSAWLWVAFGLLCPGAAFAGQRADTRLQPDELRRLERGQLVAHRTSERRGRLQLIGGTSWQVIDAPPDAVWAALLDTAHYSRILPQLIEAKLVRDGGNSRVVYLRHGNAFAQTAYYLDVRLDRVQHEINFRIDASRPSDVREAFGFYAVRAYAPGRSLLAYGVMADIGDGLVRDVMRPLIHEWMMKVPWLVKRFVETTNPREPTAS